MGNKDYLFVSRHIESTVAFGRDTLTEKFIPQNSNRMKKIYSV